MKFTSKIVEQICEELMKVPNIRYVCNKIGIDHSTFYRWMSKHHTFYKLVTGALAMGRDRMSEVAESVIIKGIQENNMGAVMYWLSHNSARYATNKQKIEYLSAVNSDLIEIIKEPAPKDESEAAFEFYFDIYYKMEQMFGVKWAETRIASLIKLMCHEDPKLEEIFYIAYADWKKDKDEIQRKTKEAKTPKE